MTFKKGDKVTHSCSSPRGEMHAEFSHYIDNATHNFSKKRVAVIYTSKERKGKEGDWLEKYCVLRELARYKDLSPKGQGKPEPLKSQFHTKPGGSPILQYFQVLYAWRGYDGCNNKYSFEKYYEWENKIRNCQHTAVERKTSHITDPVANGPMEILTNLQKQVRDNRATASPTLRNKTRFHDEQYVPGVFSRGYGLSNLSSKQEMFQRMYMNGHPDAIRGTEIHKALFDEINWFFDKKHNDLEDSLWAYMSVDWAKGHEPKSPKFKTPTFKINLENNMKATIKEVYLNGVLTQTLINDINLDIMESSDLLHHIGNTEAAIQKLTKYNGAKSKFIGQEMKRLAKFVDSVYLLLDQKFYKKSESTPVDKSV